MVRQYSCKLPETTCEIEALKSVVLFESVFQGQLLRTVMTLSAAIFFFSARAAPM